MSLVRLTLFRGSAFARTQSHLASSRSASIRGKIHISGLRARMSANHGSAGSTRHSNRLANAKSPYLLQHAENPVDWYEWGPEAFQKARGENKPIFLSVGYSACHWCHVLAHESFEDEVTAALMNKYYVNVKVDREERPDVDRLYMTFLQSTSGGGGWPMSVWMTPDLHPFFAGTYFPKGQFRVVLDKLAELWADDQDQCIESGKQIIEHLQSASSVAPSESPLSIPTASNTIFARLCRIYDPAHGGFATAPKFPSPAQTTHFLARFAALHLADPQNKLREESETARDMAVHTLVKIYNGGIRDVVGGGFARYSVDERWHVPHFEKMLYDEAQLLTSALELSLLLYPTSPHRATLRAMAADIVSYVSRDLRDPLGAFYSAEDADSFPTKDSTVKKEGAFYVWTAAQLDEVLDAESGVFKYHFGVRLDGNCDPRHDVQGELTGQNVLYTAHTIEETAERFKLSSEQVQASLDSSLAKLKEYRDKHRPRPHLDDKILTCWNGLMISGLAKASEILPEHPSNALKLAEDAAAFLRAHLYDEITGTLLRSWRDGPGPVGQADDYAFLIQGLLDLYEASGKEAYALWAVRLQDKLDELFYDRERGGYFSSAPDPHILVRMKDAQDGAEPSAVSVTLHNLQRLSHLAEDRHEEYTEKARSVLNANSQLLEKAPFALATMVGAAVIAESGYMQFILTGQPNDPRTEQLLTAVRMAPILNRVLVHLNPDDPPRELAKLNGTLRALLESGQEKEIEAVPNVRICKNFTCGLPVHDVMQLSLPQVQA